MIKCRKCGAEVEKGDAYCPECGTKIKVAKETRKITVWTFLEVIGVIVFLIIFVNVFKYQPPMALILLALFLIWTGLLNGILKKLFNAEISTGVKIIVTVLIIVLFLMVAQQTSQVQVSKVEMVPELKPLDESIYTFVEKVEVMVESKDYEELKRMLEEGAISEEVFKDISSVMGNENIRVSLDLVDKNLNEKSLTVLAKMSSDREKGEGKTMWYFERTGDRWRLSSIRPRLSNIRLSKSFGEEAGETLRKIQEPIIVISQTEDTSSKTKNY